MAGRKSVFGSRLVRRAEVARKTGFAQIFVLAVALVALISCGHGDGRLSSGNSWSSVVDAQSGAATGSPDGEYRGSPETSQSLGEVLADIERYPAPGNVDKATFELLREELKRQLGERGISRFTSAVKPDSALVENYASVGRSGGAQILWEAHLTGDTNNDGEVSIADLTPIALRYLKRSGDGSEDGYDAPCDADRDGEVGITDITPIALNYLSRLDGYNVYWKATETGTPSLVAGTTFLESPSTPPSLSVYTFTGRQNVYLLNDSAGGAASGFYEIRPVSGGSEITPGSEIYYVPDNLLAAPNPAQVLQGADRDDEVGLLKDEIIVNFSDNATLEDMILSVYSTGIGAHIAGKLSGSNGLQLKTTGDVLNMSADMLVLESRLGVNSVEKNFLLPTPDLGSTPSFVNPEPDASLQWNLQAIHAEDAWDWGLGAGVAVGGQGTVIAFIDTGIDTDNPEFAGKIDPESIYIDGKPRAPGNPDNSAYIEDEDGHGTAVAAIAAALQNGAGMSGVAYAAQILVVKTGFATGTGKWYIPASSLAEGIYYAVARNATVIHISNAVTTDPGEAVHRAIEYALANNIPVICPAGDYGGNADLVYPASYIESLTIGATDSLDGRASFSNFGNSVAVAAPGSLVYSANIAGGYQNYSRTTLASAQVAAAVAMIRAIDPTMAPSGIRSLLRSHVTPLAPALGLGTGIIDLGATLPAVPNAKTTLAPPDPVTATPGDGLVSLDWPSSVDPAVSGYFVYRDTVSGFTPGAVNELTQIIGRTVSQWNDATVLNGRTYYYQVKAYGTGNNWSLPSVEVSATPWPLITGLLLSPGGPGLIVATWDDVLSGELLLTGYNVYYNTVNDFGSSIPAPGSPFTAPSAVVSGLTNGQEYWFWVTVLGEGTNESGPSPSQSLISGVPEAPMNVVATDGAFADHCEVTWNPVSGVTGYNVFRAGDASGTNETMLGQPGPSQQTFQDTTGSLGVHYYYRVSASNVFGAGPKSAFDEGWRGLSAPSGVNATDGTHFGYVRVNWIADPQADDYELWRGTAPGGPYFAEIASSTGGATVFDDNTAVADVHYWYVVVSKLGADAGPASNDDEGWRQVLPPNNVVATDGTQAGYTTITWNVQPEANDYEVWRGNSSGGPYSTQVTASTGGAATFDDATGLVNVHYWYVVKSKLGTDKSQFSADDEGWRQLLPPANVAATDGTYSGFVRITWDVATGADDYEVWRGDATGGPYATQVAATTGGALTFDDTTGLINIHYWYVVKSKFGADRSTFSAEDEGWRTAMPTWHLETVDQGNDVGHWSSIALDQTGKPHISYYDFTSGDLKYAYYDGSFWGKAAVDTTGWVGEYTSIDLDSNNRPHISYYDSTNGDLKYAYFNGSSWQISTVESADNVGGYSGIALDSNNRPHISYRIGTGGYLKYAYYDGSSWQITTVDSTGDVAYYTDIALDSSDLPHISYVTQTFPNTLKYAHYDGSSWQVSSVDNATTPGTSIALDSGGVPHISYLNGSLCYARKNGPVWQITTVDPGAGSGRYSSIAIDSSDRPHISYANGTNNDFKYAFYDGSVWQITVLDTVNPQYTGIALDSSGWPHISYHAGTTNTLKYAWFGY